MYFDVHAFERGCYNCCRVNVDESQKNYGLAVLVQLTSTVNLCENIN